MSLRLLCVQKLINLRIRRSIQKLHTNRRTNSSYNSRTRRETRHIPSLFLSLGLWILILVMITWGSLFWSLAWDLKLWRLCSSWLRKLLDLPASRRARSPPRLLSWIWLAFRTSKLRTSPWVQLRRRCRRLGPARRCRWLGCNTISAGGTCEGVWLWMLQLWWCILPRRTKWGFGLWGRSVCDAGHRMIALGYMEKRLDLLRRWMMLLKKCLEAVQIVLRASGSGLCRSCINHLLGL